MKHLEKHRYMLEVLKIASPKLRKAMLQNVDDELVSILAEIILNITEGNVKISPSLKRRLKQYKTSFRKIVRNCNHCKNKRMLRKNIVQTGGALPIIIPAIMSLIGKAALAGAVSTGVGVATKKILGG